eukprot:6488064-Prymnesium_polylepis.1
MVPDAVRIAELLAIGEPVAVAVLPAQRLVPAEAGRAEVAAERVTRKAHVRYSHARRRVDRLRQRRNVADSLPHRHKHVAVGNLIDVLPMRIGGRHGDQQPCCTHVFAVVLEYSGIGIQVVA